MRKTDNDLHTISFGEYRRLKEQIAELKEEVAGRAGEHTEFVLAVVNADLNKKVAKLEAALDRYGWHLHGCDAMRFDDGRPRPCTCGWDELKEQDDE